MRYYRRYAVTRETFSLTSQFWVKGDVYEQGSVRETAPYKEDVFFHRGHQKLCMSTDGPENE